MELGLVCSLMHHQDPFVKSKSLVSVIVAGKFLASCHVDVARRLPAGCQFTARAI